MNMNRFQPPTSQEQQEWILCEQCESNQAEIEHKTKYFCEQCYDKWQEENLSPCCGVEFDHDIRLCPKCKEHI